LYQRRTYSVFWRIVFHMIAFLLVASVVSFPCEAARLSGRERGMNLTLDSVTPLEKAHVDVRIHRRPAVTAITQFVTESKELLRDKVLVKANAPAPPSTDSVATSIDSAIGRFVLGTFGATLVVLCVCSDDIIWLLAFLAGTEKAKYVAFYMFTMVFMWAFSYFLTLVVMVFSLKYTGADVVEWAMMVSAVFLSLLTLKFLHEYIYGGLEEVEEGKNETQCEIVTLQRDGTTLESDTHEAADVEQSAEVLHQEEDAKTMVRTSKSVNRSLSNLFLVSIAGNVDNIAIYITILLNETFTPLELCLGTVIAGVVVSALTLGLSRFEFIMTLIGRIPLWVIIGGLAGYVWCSVLTHVPTM